MERTRDHDCFFGVILRSVFVMLAIVVIILSEAKEQALDGVLIPRARPKFSSALHQSYGGGVSYGHICEYSVWCERARVRVTGEPHVGRLYILAKTIF